MEGSAWAASSARTLARRLRRKARDERGLNRAAALAVRAKAMRAALAAHWELGDALGWHPATMGEAVAAARLLQLPEQIIAEAEELCSYGNWGRHAPPADGHRLPGAVVGIKGEALEGFRAELYGMEYGIATAERSLAAELDAESGPGANLSDARCSVSGGLEEIEESADEPEVDPVIGLAACADGMQETQVNGGGGAASLPVAETHIAAEPTRQLSQREQGICDLMHNFAVLLGIGDGCASSSPSPWLQWHEEKYKEWEEIVGGAEPASSFREDELSVPGALSESASADKRAPGQDAGESESGEANETPQETAPFVAPGAQQRGLQDLLDGLNMRVFSLSPLSAASARSLESLGVECAAEQLASILTFRVKEPSIWVEKAAAAQAKATAPKPGPLLGLLAALDHFSGVSLGLSGSSTALLAEMETEKAMSLIGQLLILGVRRSSADTWISNASTAWAPPCAGSSGAKSETGAGSDAAAATAGPRPPRAPESAARARARGQASIEVGAGVGPQAAGQRRARR